MRRLFRQLPEVQRISVVELRPDDVLIIEAAGQLSAEQAMRIKHTAERNLPGRKVLVLSDGLTVSALRENA